MEEVGRERKGLIGSGGSLVWLSVICTKRDFKRAARKMHRSHFRTKGPSFFGKIPMHTHISPLGNL